MCLRRYYYKTGKGAPLVPLNDDEKRELDGLTVDAVLAKYAPKKNSKQHGVGRNGPEGGGRWLVTAKVLNERLQLGTFRVEEAAGRWHDSVAVAQGGCAPQ